MGRKSARHGLGVRGWDGGRKGGLRVLGLSLVPLQRLSPETRGGEGEGSDTVWAQSLENPLVTAVLSPDAPRPPQRAPRAPHARRRGLAQDGGAVLLWRWCPCHRGWGLVPKATMGVEVTSLRPPQGQWCHPQGHHRGEALPNAGGAMLRPLCVPPSHCMPWLWCPPHPLAITVPLSLPCHNHHPAPMPLVSPWLLPCPCAPPNCLC